MTRIALVNGTVYEVANFRESYRKFNNIGDIVLTFQLVDAEAIPLETLVNNFTTENVATIELYNEVGLIDTFTGYTNVQTIDRNILDNGTVRIDINITK